jgi:hypothetical protein
MTDSTTAEGWLKKSNFSKLGESPLQSLVQIEAAQKQATLFMSLGNKSYGQWFQGVTNKVPNALSHDDNWNNEAFTNIFHQFCPSQIPSHFKIVPLHLKNYLMADCIAADITRESAVQRKTHETQAKSWKHWEEYNEFIQKPGPLP